MERNSFGAVQLSKRCSTQMIFTIFAVFLILIDKYYGSLLTASLIVRKCPSLYNDLDEVIKDGKYGIIIRANTSTVSDLKNAKTGPLKRIWDKIQSDPNGVVPSTGLGFKKVLSGNFVFLTAESYSLPFILNSNCAYALLKQRYLRMTMHLVLPKGSPSTEIMSLKILQMRSSGILSKLQDEHIGKYDAESCKPEHSMTVSLQQTIGAFALYSIGILFSCVVLIFELLLRDVQVR